MKLELVKIEAPIVVHYCSSLPGREMILTRGKNRIIRTITASSSPFRIRNLILLIVNKFLLY